MNFKEWLISEELKSANAPKISLTPKAKPIDVNSNYYQQNNQRIAALGRHFKDNDGKEPYHMSPLGQWLYQKRRAYQDFINNTKIKTTRRKWYDTDLQVAQDAGLPDDWHTNTEKYKPESKKDIVNKAINDQQIAALGRHFKDNDGKEPYVKSTLGMWLYNKRKAFRDYENMQKNPKYQKKSKYKWYDTDLEVGKNAGLPDDWHLFTDKYKVKSNLRILKNNQQIAALGRHFKDNDGKEPPIESTLGVWLYNKRKAFRDYENIKRDPNYPRTTNSKWYDTDLEVGKNAGLPDDWHTNTKKYKPENKQLQNFKKINDDNIKKLGVYYKKFGEPNTESDEGRFLYGKRRAYQDFINKTNTTSTRWYDTDEQVGINAGLPKGWHLPVEKQKLSQGEMQIRHVLDYFKIEHETQGTDRECVGQSGQCLRFDFSFDRGDPEEPTRYFIEYHGQQHYYPVLKASTKNRQKHAKLALNLFEGVQYRDKLKYNYCKQNKFPLLVIPYWTPFSDIKEIIEEFLKHDRFDKIFANPEVPEDLKEKHKQIYKKYYDMSINKT